MLFKVMQLVAVIMLLIAVSDLPYDYYTILRFVVCPVSAYGAFLAKSRKKPFWLWSLGICAIIFNPIAKIHFERETWFLLNLLAALLILVSVFMLSTKSQKPEESAI